MTIQLQNDIIYGPVRSRRLGRSLGINLLPTSFKICTFNCLYCQYGWTQVHGRYLADKGQWPMVSQVFTALEQALLKIVPPPAYITFSGNGEPSIHPKFSEIIDGVCQLRDKIYPTALLAILSNSTTVTEPDIRKAISKLDVKIMKLDCGTPMCFQEYNRPSPGINYSEIIDALSRMENITIQSLFSAGPKGNYNSKNVDEWLKRLQQISPDKVQIYTLDRAFPSKDIFVLEKDQLFQIKERLNHIGISAEVY